MRLLPLAAGLSLLVGCAHPSADISPVSPSEGRDREVVAVADRNEPVVEITESAPPPLVAESGARPRLSHVVTLGQGTSDAQYYGPDAPRQAQSQSGPSVVVNNNVNVGGGYGGGTYGGYYGGGYAGSGSRGSRSSSSAPRTESGYAPTGWEGAGRTAGQGQTPGVGGNWPTAPSYGPRQAR